MFRTSIADALAALFLLAAVYVLVRPRSKGAELVRDVGDALTALTAHATDLSTAQ